MSAAVSRAFNPKSSQQVSFSRRSLPLKQQRHRFDAQALLLGRCQTTALAFVRGLATAPQNKRMQLTKRLPFNGWRAFARLFIESRFAADPRCSADAGP